MRAGPRRRPAIGPEDPTADVRAELDAHFEGSVELLVARGWTEAAARAEVRRRFGDERHHRARLEGSARRRSVRRRVIETWRAFTCAVAAGIGGVRRAPGLSAGVVVTLALGLGANAAIFRLVDRLLLSPPPHLERADEVRRVYRTLLREDGDSWVVGMFSYADVRAVREASPEVRVAAVMNYLPETLGSGVDAVRLHVARVDAEYFPLLGIRPLLGRGLMRQDHAQGAAVVVLSHAAWQSQFGGDEGVLGRRIRAARGEYEVVGVMPRGFHGSHGPTVDLWIPVEAEAAAWWGDDWRTSPDVFSFSLLARIPRAIPVAAWEARMAGALRDSETGAALRSRLLSVTTSSLVPGDAPQPTGTISVSRWLMGVSLLVLLVACANVANLFLAHAERHRRETAVRLALGAGAAALRTELLARALCLALLGAASAVLLASWAGQVLDGMVAAGLESYARPGTTRIVVFTGTLGIGAALLAGLLPALRAPRLDVRRALERGGRAVGRVGLARRSLAGVQVALSMVLLVGAGLFVASFRNALRVDLGFAHDRLIVLRLERADGVDTPLSQLLVDARERILRVPGVESASGTVAVPFDVMYGLSATLGDGAPIADLHLNVVGEDYFRTMGLRVERGRALDRNDMRTGAEPVVVVSRRAAARLWPDGDPLGHCLHVGAEGPCARVVGVAGDHAGAGFNQHDLGWSGTMQAWVPSGFPGAQPTSTLLVRTAGPPARLLTDVRRAAAVSGVRYVEMELIGDIVGRITRPWRLGAGVFSLFGRIALLVAGVGLFGVLSFEVAQRRREIGIRAALGADRLRMILPVVNFAGPVIGAGLIAGTGIAILAAGRLRDLLFEIGPRDPVVLAAAAGGIVAVALAALLAPAWRAARVDPRETLADGG